MSKENETLISIYLKRKFKRRVRKSISLGCILSLLPILFIGMILIAAISSNEETSDYVYDMDAETKGLSEATENLRPIVEKEAKLQGIPEYVPYLMGIIEVESRGQLPDPMQSSESAGHSRPGVLADAESSIKQGVKYFKQGLDMANTLGTDVWSAVQGYNMGHGVIQYVANNGKKLTMPLMDKYSRNVVAPSLGNTTGKTYVHNTPIAIAYNGGFLYLNGGNMFYHEYVRQYVSEGKHGGKNIQSNGKYVLPLDSPNMSSGFGVRSDPLGRGTSFHRGLDFSDPFGTPIKAIQEGTVLVATQHYSWGNYVTIEHPDGKVSLYAHQSEMLVKVGQKVKAGQVIGKVGSTGDSTGPHLHIEIAKSRDLSQGNLLDPAIVLGLI